MSRWRREEYQFESYLQSDVQLRTLYNPAMMSLFHLAMIIPTLTSVPFKLVGNIIPSFTDDMPSEVSAGASVVAGGASGSSSSSSSLRI